MSSVPANADTIGVRPSRLIAEALVNQHDSNHVMWRAEKLGLSADLTEAMVAVCCCDKRQTAESEALRNEPELTPSS